MSQARRMGLQGKDVFHPPMNGRYHGTRLLSVAFRLKQRLGVCLLGKAVQLRFRLVLGSEHDRWTWGSERISPWVLGARHH